MIKNLCNSSNLEKYAAIVYVEWIKVSNLLSSYSNIKCRYIKNIQIQKISNKFSLIFNFFFLECYKSPNSLKIRKIIVFNQRAKYNSLWKVDHCSSFTSITFGNDFLKKWSKPKSTFFSLMATFFCSRDSRRFCPSSLKV